MILKVFSCELIMSKDSDVSNPPHPVSHVLVWRIWGALHFHGDTRTESTPLRYVTFLGFLVWPTATPSVQASPFCEQHLLTWSVMQSRVHLVLRHKHALLHCCRLMLLEKKRIKKKTIIWITTSPPAGQKQAVHRRLLPYSETSLCKNTNWSLK